MNATEPVSAGTYTPGYAWPKRFMILLGLALFALGFWQLRTPLGLLAFGTRVTGEVVSVVKTKPGLPDVVFHDEAGLRAGLETRDRSFVFWNEFRFETADGHSITVRTPVGSQLKPLYPLIDADGLPSTDTIYYDPKHPDVVAFPDILSVWFAPGALAFIGFLAMLIGAVLLYWSDKPIELPHLPPPSATEASKP